MPPLAARSSRTVASCPASPHHNGTTRVCPPSTSRSHDSSTRGASRAMRRAPFSLSQFTARRPNPPNAPVTRCQRLSPVNTFAGNSAAHPVLGDSEGSQRVSPRAASQRCDSETALNLDAAFPTGCFRRDRWRQVTVPAVRWPRREARPIARDGMQRVLHFPRLATRGE